MARVRAISCNSKISLAKSNGQLLAIILQEVLEFDTILASFFLKPCLHLASRTPHSPSFLSASLIAFLPSPFAGFPSTLMCQCRCMRGLSLLFLFSSVHTQLGFNGFKYHRHAEMSTCVQPRCFFQTPIVLNFSFQRSAWLPKRHLKPKFSKPTSPLPLSALSAAFTPSQLMADLFFQLFMTLPSRHWSVCLFFFTLFSV